MPSPNAINLKQLGLLEIVGSGAKELLQGQITIDIEKVKSNYSLHGALCNIKGRIISSFIVTKSLDNEQGFWLIMSKDVLKKTQETLEKYSPFYKVSMEDISLEWTYIGLKELDLNNTLSQFRFLKERNTERKEHFIITKSLNSGYIIVNRASQSIDIKPSNDSDIWDSMNISSLNPEICLETSEIYTPHELNYHLNERIDFTKGCYTGQEIVARMNYRAKTLPRIYKGRCSDTNLKLNMNITEETKDETSQKGGKLGNIIGLRVKGDKSDILVSLKNSSSVDNHFLIGKNLIVKETGSSISLKK